MIENNPHVHNGVVDEFEMLHDEVMTVEGLTDEERQLAYVKLVRHDELRVSFSHCPTHEKKDFDNVWTTNNLLSINTKSGTNIHKTLLYSKYNM